MKNGDVRPTSVGLEKARRFVGGRRAHFDENSAAAFQIIGGRRDDASDDLDAGFAPDEREFRLEIANRRLELGVLGRGNVRRVADDDVETTLRFQRGKEVGFDELDAVGDPVFLGVAASDGQRGGGNVERR